MSDSGRDRFLAGSDVLDVSDSDRDRFFPLPNVLVITAGNIGVYSEEFTVVAFKPMFVSIAPQQIDPAYVQ